LCNAQNTAESQSLYTISDIQNALFQEVA